MDTATTFDDRLATAARHGENDRETNTFGAWLDEVVTLGEDQREQAIMVRAYADAFIRIDSNHWQTTGEHT